MLRVAKLVLIGAVLMACGDAFTPVVIVTDAPSFGAVSALASDTVLVMTITARNETSQLIEYSRRFPCGVFIRLHADESRSELVWDQRDWWNARSGGCKGLTIEKLLEPGASERLGASATVREMLGDSLASGGYYVTGLVLGDPDLDQIVIPAGHVELSRS